MKCCADVTRGLLMCNKRKQQRNDAEGENGSAGGQGLGCVCSTLASLEEARGTTPVFHRRGPGRALGGRWHKRSPSSSLTFPSFFCEKAIRLPTRMSDIVSLANMNLLGREEVKVVRLACHIPLPLPNMPPSATRLRADAPRDQRPLLQLPFVS
ncbi:hypothetical protein SKAU_G00134920 [Synaphobranchus kaupii]|uniref:Uncharacterized protein n=1 Tax=Synaphobranchus kaupii TaxID=118154 RepID=A0A9Q1FR48_SYNKA|nr:hypothetical protein SKAU_G00134920 [Synaphobranchus kaupii]